MSTTTPTSQPTEQITTVDRLKEVGAHATILASHVMRWQDRDSTTAVGAGRVHPRAAAALAIEDIDELSRVLFALRNQLIGESRAYDDETARRTDALLAGRDATREAVAR